MGRRKSEFPSSSKQDYQERCGNNMPKTFAPPPSGEKSTTKVEITNLATPHYERYAVVYHTYPGCQIVSEIFKSRKQAERYADFLEATNKDKYETEYRVHQLFATTYTGRDNR
jgi:hypothetical protein